MHARMVDLVERIAAAGQRRVDASGGGWESASAFAGALAALRADHANAPGPSDPVADLAAVFGLDDVDADLLWSAAAADLDANVALAYAAIGGANGLAWPSVGLVLELAGIASSSADGFARLDADAPLQRFGLLEIVGSQARLARSVRVPDVVLSALAGADPSDPVVTPLRCAITARDLPHGEQIGRAVVNGVPLVWVHAPVGSPGAALAAGAVAGLGMSWLAVDVRRSRPGAELAEALARCAREAALRARVLIVVGGELLADSAEHGAFRALAAAVPVVVVSSRPWNAAWLPRFPIVVNAEPLTVTDRAAIWREQLGQLVVDDNELRQTLLGLRLTPDDAAEAARYAQVLALAQDRPVDAQLVREAARRIGGSRGTSADHVEPAASAGGGPGFDDLVLPDHVTASLRRLVSWGRHRNEVNAHGPLRGRGRGIAALFAGNPGTGKTLAAHVIAEELSVDLFQVELSAVVDKYIGETEKNLEKVFQAAEALDVVLFFDEADALFGSRSEVHDARDRYANQEVSYLLQRMEQFDGITILATNLRGNLDRAFSRRMSFIVHFPDPDPAIRRRLWEYHLAQLPNRDSRDQVRIDLLADQADLTGGDIRNIVLAAAYDAISEDAAVGMRHVVDATVREYRKLGRVVPEHGFLRPPPS
ncbi:MAG: ATP-binding protein [Jatrophihabitantaceae bacterium]